MEKGKKTGKRLMSWLLAVVMMLSLVPGSGGIQVQAAGSTDTTSTTENEVKLHVDKSPKLEVALAVGNTKQTYGSFNDDLKAALLKKGIQSDNISFVQVDANAVQSQSSFNWWTYDHSRGLSSNASNHIYMDTVPSNNNNNPYDTIGANNSITVSTNTGSKIVKSHIVDVNGDGATMNFYGYGQMGYTDFNYLPNEQATKKTIEFTIQEKEAHDALDGLGFLVNTSITGTTYSNSSDTAETNQVINGYLIFLQYTGSVGENIKLYKLTGVNAYNLHNTSKSVRQLGNIAGVRLLSTATTSYSSAHTYRKFKIEVMPEYIKMWYAGDSNGFPSVTFDNSNTTNLVSWGDGSTEYKIDAGYDQDTVNNKEVYRGGYGPLASYGSHNCERQTLATLSNLKMDADYVRSLTEVVREPNWSSDKQSFLVNLNEDAIDDFSADYTTAEIINRLEQENVTYIGWCGSKNVTASEAFVKGISSGSGLVNMNSSDMIASGKTYYDKESYNKQIDAIAQIIADKVEKQSTEGGVYTYLDTDDFHFSAENATLNDGAWSVGYSSDSFEDTKNSVSKYADLATAPFTLPGYYEVYYGGDIETPKAKIRIHQAPKALFSAKVKEDTASTEETKPYYISIENKSYDPDKTTGVGANGSEEDGIATTKIEYRNVTQNGDWVTEAPSNVTVGDIWTVRLTVTDTDGASDMLLQQVTRQTGGSTQTEGKAPFNAFTLSKNQYITGIDEYVEVIDQSYSLDGEEFTVNYNLTNNTNNTVTNLSFEAGQTNKYPLSSLSAGSYTISMTATSTTSNKTSATVKHSFAVKVGYTVTYDADTTNGGKGAPSTQYKIKDEALTLSSVAPSNSDAKKIFAGWDAGSDGNADYQPGDVYEGNASLTLKAIWKEAFTYQANGYTGVYDAQEHNISVRVSYPEAEEGVTIKYAKATDLNSTVAEENINQTDFSLKDVGKYKVYYKIEKDGFLTVSGSRIVEITKADPKEVKLSNKVYLQETGSQQGVDAATVTGVADENVIGADITYTYFTDKELKSKTTQATNGAATVGGAPKSKGHYYVKAVFNGNNNYNSKESNVATLDIAPSVYYYNADGGTTYGTLEDVLAATDNSKKRIYIEENMLIEESVEIPSGYTLFVVPDVEVTLSQGVTLTNNGTIRNSGTFNGDGKIINNKTFDGGIVSVPFINNGTVSYTDFKDSENPEKEVPVTNNNTMNDCTGDDIENGENGKVQIDGAVETYDVTFDATANLEDKTLTSNPSKQTINWGDKITDEPVIEDIEGVAEFQGWYQEKECTNAWNFTKDTVNSDITLYAKWKEYSTFEAYWVDQDGKKHYGTFENVLSQIKNRTEETTCEELHIQKEVSITDNVTVPDDIPV
ncbi:MAG: InlB B-repeat-containing protein, partial [Clostridiales bacterium]|nr:InlB B-repeat-containing protein [Clostridiales bacterium]